MSILKDSNGVFVHDDDSKARLLNEFYSSVFVTDNMILPNFGRRVADSSELGDVSFPPDAVYKILNQLKPKSSGGPDGLTALFLKNVAGSLAYPLSILFSTSFQLSKLPDIWKTAIVTPIFKKGCPSSASNYRPISLTCIISKVMETNIY